MKKYKLLKDLPTFKAGEIFEIRTEDPVDGSCLYHAESGIMAYHCNTLAKFPEILAEGSEWFEEIKEEGEPWGPALGNRYWGVDPFTSTTVSANEYQDSLVDRASLAIGNCFKTKREAERAVEWLKAFKVLRDDTKGFKPDWKRNAQGYWSDKWFVSYDYFYEKFIPNPVSGESFSLIYFATEEDAEASIEAHEKEWKIFLGVEE